MKSHNKIFLGIETSCDDTCIGIIQNKKILANVIISQDEYHNLFGGIVPNIAGNLHLKNICFGFRKALVDANLNIEQIDYICVTRGPGLIGSLLVGNAFAEGICARYNKPLIGVDHLQGHIMVSRLNHSIEFPFLSLLLSGGHTMICVTYGPSKTQVIGTTLDDALGEVFDKIGKHLNFDFPGGKHIDKYANSGEYINNLFPRILEHDHFSCNFSFSGIKTAVIRAIDCGNYSVENICHSFRKVCTDLVLRNLKRAVEKTGVKTIVAGGGVIASSFIRQSISDFCENNKLLLVFPDPILCTDNGVMIAAAGMEMVNDNVVSPMDVYPNCVFDFVE